MCWQLLITCYCKQSKLNKLHDICHHLHDICPCLITVWNRSKKGSSKCHHYTFKTPIATNVCKTWLNAKTIWTRATEHRNLFPLLTGKLLAEFFLSGEWHSPSIWGPSVCTGKNSEGIIYFKYSVHAPAKYFPFWIQSQDRKVKNAGICCSRHRKNLVGWGLWWSPTLTQSRAGLKTFSAIPQKTWLLDSTVLCANLNQWNQWEICNYIKTFLSLQWNSYTWALNSLKVRTF